MMTIDITIHDKMSASWQKGVGGRKLREIVRTKYGTNCHRFYTKILHELEQPAISAFKIRMAYKSPRGIHWVAYTSEIQMELFIISAQGMCLKVLI